MRKYKSFWVVLIYFSYISYPKIIATHIQYKGRTEKNYNNSIYHVAILLRREHFSLFACATQQYYKSKI